MRRLTIHTATYNRAYILEKAYRSLCNQTAKDFEWIITDDGSADETEQLVHSWTNNDNGFPIVYNKLPHVGIPRALNAGVNLASTPWFMMLDSDDELLPQAVELVLGWLEEVEDKDHFVGIGYAKCYPDGSYMKDQIPLIDPAIGYVDATNLERPLYHLDMDMNEVYRVEVLKAYPFVYYGDEVYAPEQLPFNQMALDGWKLRWRDVKLYICDYLPDGQTRDDRLVKNNPMGFAMMYDQNALVQKGLLNRCRQVLYMIALCFYAGHMEYLLKCHRKGLALILLLPGIALGFRRKKQFSKLK